MQQIRVEKLEEIGTLRANGEANCIVGQRKGCLHRLVNPPSHVFMLFINKYMHTQTHTHTRLSQAPSLRLNIAFLSIFPGNSSITTWIFSRYLQAVFYFCEQNSEKEKKKNHKIYSVHFCSHLLGLNKPGCPFSVLKLWILRSVVLCTLVFPLFSLFISKGAFGQLLYCSIFPIVVYSPNK